MKDDDFNKYVRFDHAAATLPAPNAPATSDSARRAAREWMDTYHAAFKTNQEREDALVAIISKHFAAAPANTGGFTCDCCGRNTELRINGKFCNECAGYRAAAPADNDAE